MSQNNGHTLTAPGPDLTSTSELEPSTCQPKPPENAITITIGISAEVLLNMEKEQQVEHGMRPFSHGPAFSFVKVLMAVNTQLKKLYPDSEELFDVVFMTNNHPYVGLRLINTINHHQLSIERFCMTGGNSVIGYLKAYHTNLYLSSDPDKVEEALKEGIAAATMFTPEKITEVSDTQLRVAFDGDGVLFSDESERIFKTDGLVKFLENEKEHENKPLEHGPLKGFLEALEKLQKKFYDKGQRMDCPIRTYLVTARSASSSGYRALKTLRSWDLEMNEAHFLDGAPKGPILEKIRPHIFFDDKMSCVEGAVEIGTVACHVPYGICQGPVA